MCRCVPQCEIDSLYSDEDLCTEENRCGGEDSLQYFDKESGLCFYSAHCKMLCPEGQELIPTEMCRCAYQSEIDALYDMKDQEEKGWSFAKSLGSSALFAAALIA